MKCNEVKLVLGIQCWEWDRIGTGMGIGTVIGWN